MFFALLAHFPHSPSPSSKLGFRILIPSPHFTFSLHKIEHEDEVDEEDRVAEEEDEDYDPNQEAKLADGDESYVVALDVFCSERRWSEGRDQVVVEICVGLVDDENDEV
ncbi:hypothetical protein Droror1_Dr00020797 [Drosera rotundifolia]